jgi:hypothetical protein
MAYVWWLEPSGQPPLCWIILDVCLMSVPTVRDLAARLSSSAKIPADRIMISATHTHSGPDVRLLHANPAPWSVRYRERLIRQIRPAIDSARQSVFEGDIHVRQGTCEIGVNRRDVTMPIDPRVVLLDLVDRAGQSHGLLFWYSCHLTVLGVDNYLISADWAGPVRRKLEQETGHPVAFIQGAEGNIDPESRGVLDMGDPDQAKGATFQTVQSLADRMAGALRDAARHEPIVRLRDIHQRCVVAELPLRYGALTSVQIDRRIAQWEAELGGFLGIDAAQVPEHPSINAIVKERCRALELPRDQCRKWVAEQFAFNAFLNMYKRGAGGSGSSGGEVVDRERGLVHLPLALLDFGQLLILCVPAEVLVEIAFEFQQRLAPRVALIAALANGWSGYLPHASNFAEPAADARYETVSSVFAPDAATKMLDVVTRLAKGATG